MMKININRYGLRMALVLVFALCAKFVSAENRLYIEPFSLNGDATTRVSVMLDNDEPVAGYSFELHLSQGLELDGDPIQNAERANQGSQFMYNAANGMIMGFEVDKSGLKGNSGAVVYLPVRLAAGASQDATYSIELTKISVSGLGGQGGWNQANETVQVSVVSGTVSAYLTETELIVNPGETFEIPVSIANTCRILGLQLYMETPAGFEVIKSVETNGTRVPYNSWVQVETNGNTTGFVVANLGGGDAITGTDGNVFTISVTAPEDFAAETATIKFNGLMVSAPGNKPVYGENFSLELTNGVTALNRANAELEALRNELAAALAQVAELAPDVKDQFTGADITARIDALAEAVAAAYKNHTLTTSYDEVMADVAGIREAIEALVPAAENAERLYKNEVAYKEAQALMASLQEQFNNAKAALATEYPNANVEARLAEIQEWFNQMNAALEEDYENSKAAGTFVFRDPTAYYQEYMEGIIAEAQRQQNNYNYFSENKEQIAYLNTLVDETVAALVKEHSYVNLEAQAASLKAEFAEVLKAMEEAYAAVATEGTYKFDFDMSAAEAKVAKVLGDEAARQVSNHTAYDATVAEINKLQAALDAAKAKVAKECPIADVAADFNAIQAEITAALEGAAAALEAVATEGTYEFTFDAAAISGNIDVTVAKAQLAQSNYNAYIMTRAQIESLYQVISSQATALTTLYPGINLDATVAALRLDISILIKKVEEAYKNVPEGGIFSFDFNKATYEAHIISTLKAEAERQANNLALYNEVKAQIAALYEMLDAKLAEIKTQYPAADVTTLAEVLRGDFAEAAAGADAAFAAVATAGTFSYDFDKSAYERKIDNLADFAAKQQTSYNNYQEALAVVADLQKKLNDAAAAIAKDYPVADVSNDVEFIQNELNNLRAAIEADYAANKMDYANTVETEPFIEAIEALTAKAQKQQANYDLYQEAKAQIAALYEMLDAKVAELKAQYPNCNLDAAAAALKEEFAAEDKRADEAYANMEDSFKFDFDKGVYERKIDELAALAERQQAGYDKYTAALADIEALQQKLDEALATVAKDYTAADVTAQAELIQTSLNDLKAAVEEEFAKGTADFGIVVETEVFTEAIDALLADAKRQQTNAEAHQEALNLIAALQEQFNASKAALATEYPNADVEARLAEIQEWLNTQVAAANEDYENTKKAGVFVFPDPTAGYQDYMEAVIAEAERQQNNYNLYEEAKAQVAALYEMLDEKVAAVKAEFPNCNIDADVDALKAEFAAEEQRAAEAYAAVATEGTFKFDFNKGAFEEKIEGIQYIAERQQINYNNYTQAVADVAEMQKLLDDAKAKIAAEYPEANVSEAEAVIQGTINDINDIINEYDATTLAGTFVNPVEKEMFTEAIDAMLADAERQQDNYNNYAETVATLDGMQEMLDEAKATVAKNYPAANVEAQIAAAQNSINEHKAGAAEAYAAVATEGVFKYDVNYGAIEALINAIVPEAARQAANDAAYNEILKAIETLQTKLDMAKMTATQIYPESDITANVAAAQAAIDQAKADALKAKEDAGESGEIDYTVPTEEIEGKIAAILAEAKRQADNAAAYKAATDQLAALQAKLDAAKKTVEADYAGADVEELEAAAQKAIDDAKTAADAANAAVAAEGKFDYTVPAEAIEAAINAVLAEAKRQADNKTAYQAVIDQLTAYQAQLDAAKAEAEKSYPNSDIDAVAGAAQNAINDAKAAADAAKIAAATEGTFNYTLPTQAIEAAIAAIVPEAKRQADNKAAYNAVIDQLMAYQAQLEAAKAEVAKDYATADVEDFVSAAQNAINDAKADADAAKRATAEEGTFDYTLPAEDIEAAIAAIVPEAKRQIDNKKAYDATIAEIEALEAQLAATKEDAKTKYPDAMELQAVKDAIKAAEDAVAEARQGADDAYAAVAEEGEYEYALDKAAIEALIAKILETAKVEGISEVLIEELGGDVRFFNIHGVEIKHPAPGTMVIAVGANGQTRKILVK